MLSQNKHLFKKVTYDVITVCTSFFLAFPAGVLQVTWHRPSTDERIENLATFSKHFGEQVNEPYKGKVTFKERSLNSSAILLRNITWEDEGCYICAFNVYPDGSKRKQMCLTVQGR